MAKRIDFKDTLFLKGDNVEIIGKGGLRLPIGDDESTPDIVAGIIRINDERSRIEIGMPNSDWLTLSTDSSQSSFYPTTGGELDGNLVLPDHRILNQSGSVVDPSYSFLDNPHSGIYHDGTDTINIVVGGNRNETPLVEMRRTGDDTLDQEMIIHGDLTVEGTETVINSEVLTVEDNVITLNKGGTNSGKSGIEIEADDSIVAQFTYSFSDEKWDAHDSSITNVIKPENDLDVTNKIYVDTEIQELRDDIDSEVERLDQRIDDEEERAKAEEERIENKFDGEVERLDGEVERLDQRVDDEETRAINEEQRIEGRLDDEIDRAKSEEERIEDKFDGEVERLDGRIDDTNSDLQAHIDDDDAHDQYLRKDNALQGLEDIPASRDTLDVYSRSEVDQISDDNSQALQDHIDVDEAHEQYLRRDSALSNLEDVPASRDNLDVYSRSETDSNISNAVDGALYENDLQRNDGTIPETNRENDWTDDQNINDNKLYGNSGDINFDGNVYLNITQEDSSVIVNNSSEEKAVEIFDDRGVVIGSPSESSQGSGSINAETIYRDGMELDDRYYTQDYIDNLETNINNDISDVDQKADNNAQALQDHIDEDNAHDQYLRKDNALQGLEDIPASRDTLDVYSRDEVNQISDDNSQELQDHIDDDNAHDQYLRKDNALQGLEDIPASRDTLDVYSRDEVDDLTQDSSQALQDHIDESDPHDQYILKEQKGSENGVATLTSNGKVPDEQLPALAITEVFEVETIEERDDLDAQEGDIAVVEDSGDGLTRSYILSGSGNWKEINTPGDVHSVNGKIGSVTLDFEDVNADEEGTAQSIMDDHLDENDPHDQYLRKDNDLQGLNDISASRDTLDVYSRDEVDNIADGKAESQHTHSWEDDITGRPFGQRGDFLYYPEEGSSPEGSPVVEIGRFVDSEEQLIIEQQDITTFEEIFDTWYRFSHGSTDGGHGTTSDVIPAAPDETNEWFLEDDQVFTTLNSPSHIGFVSEQTYDRYRHEVTLQATGSDNDMIGLVIAFNFDEDDKVPNNAFGDDPEDYSWDMNVEDEEIPNEHSLVLLRTRTRQSLSDVDGTNSQFAIVYNYKKNDNEILVDGDDLVWNTTDGFGNPGAKCDVIVERDGDIIRVWTTDWDDAPDGKGDFQGPLEYDLRDQSNTEKFRGPAPYGYSAHSQEDSTFKNIVFITPGDSIFDIRTNTSYNYENNEWVEDTETTVTETFGIGKFLINDEFNDLFFVKDDDTIIKVVDNFRIDQIEDNLEDLEQSLHPIATSGDYDDLENKPDLSQYEFEQFGLGTKTSNEIDEPDVPDTLSGFYRIGANTDIFDGSNSGGGAIVVHTSQDRVFGFMGASGQTTETKLGAFTYDSSRGFNTHELIHDSNFEDYGDDSYLRKDNALQGLEDISASRDTLDVYSRSETDSNIDEVDSDLQSHKDSGDHDDRYAQLSEENTFSQTQEVNDRTISYSFSSPGSNVPQVIKLVRTDDDGSSSNRQRIFGDISGGRNLGSSVRGAYFQNVVAGVSGTNYEGAFQYLTNNSSLNPRLITFDHDGVRWLGIEAGTASSHQYPSTWYFNGYLNGDNTLEAIATEDVSNIEDYDRSEGIISFSTKPRISSSDVFLATEDDVDEVDSDLQSHKDSGDHDDRYAQLESSNTFTEDQTIDSDLNVTGEITENNERVATRDHVDTTIDDRLAGTLGERNVTFSEDEPDDSEGEDGDIWFVYED